MRGDMVDAHIAVRQHHHRAFNAGELGQHLGMAGVVIAGVVQRFLVQGRGHDTADPSRLGHADALLHGLEGEAAAVGR